jgi:hypothetical protein
MLIVEYTKYGMCAERDGSCLVISKAAGRKEKVH